MNQKQAVQILLRQAELRLEGAGRGISSFPEGNERKEVIEAIRKMWRTVYDFNPPDIR